MYSTYLLLSVLYLASAQYGSQKDDHNCLSSAGYVWCPSEQNCVRPFEMESSHPCSTESLTTIPIDNHKPKRTLGSRRDDHNCLASAGYVWCETEQDCIRPFEMETSHPCSTESLSNTHSETAEILGGQPDEHNCLSSAGYMWCESEQKCVQPFEMDSSHPCSTENLATASVADTESQPLGGQQDEHNCLTSAGYAWCESEQACIRPFEMESSHPCSTESLTASLGEDDNESTVDTESQFLGGQQDEHSCLTSAGYVWCESEQACIRPFEMESSHPCSTESLTASLVEDDEVIADEKHGNVRVLGNAKELEIIMVGDNKRILFDQLFANVDDIDEAETEIQEATAHGLDIDSDYIEIEFPNDDPSEPVITTIDCSNGINRQDIIERITTEQREYITDVNEWFADDSSDLSLRVVYPPSTLKQSMVVLDSAQSLVLVFVFICSVLFL